MNPGVIIAVLFLVAGADGVDDNLYGPTELKAALPGEVLPAQAEPRMFLPAQEAVSGDVMPAQATAGQILPIQGTPMMSQPALTLPNSSDTDCKLPTVWLGTEYLMWWTQKAPLPVPLVTANLNPNAAFPNAALDTPGTSVLYGGHGIDFGMASGLRITAGITLSADAGLFAEGSWLMLEKQTNSYTARSDASGYPFIAQPIVNANTGQNQSELVSQPNPEGFQGTIKVTSSTRLQGWDVNLGWEVFRSETSQLVVLGGFRSLDLLDTTTIGTYNVKDVSDVAPGTYGSANLTFLGVKDTTGANFLTEDRFRTSNIFYGGQVGARLTQELWGIFSLSGQVKLGLGATDEIATISGYSSLLSPGQPAYTVPGGVLTSNTNSGHFYRSRFAFVPEGTLSLGAQLAPWCRATVGYNMLYWSAVARPGDQINTTVNRYNIPVDQNYGTGSGPAQPSFSFHGTDYWAQGITLGLQFSY